ncbi:Uncharacterised protein [Mycobacteroides abscessus subsp. abscessus]|nr:Uncharacterised protein [Mycobacteroides abscessus subsp. abscessus]
MLPGNGAGDTRFGLFVVLRLRRLDFSSRAICGCSRKMQ